MVRAEAPVRARGVQRAAFIAAFLLPAVALYAVFVLWPLAQAFVLSLYRWRGVSPERTFIGFGNYAQLASDPIFARALAHNLALLLVGGAVIVCIAIGVSHAIHTEGRAARALRAVYLFPQVISMVVVAVLWSFVYNPSFGVLNGSLRAAGLEGWALDWLGSPSTALPAVGVVFVWHALGFHIMLLSAGLRTIPVEVSEAAALDGASGLRRLGSVTLPMLWPVLRVSMVYLVIGALNTFALVYLMTVGGPDRSTEVMLTYLYEQGFKHSEFGYATALAVANFGIVMLLSGVVMAAMRRDPTEGRA
ncbi:MAG TPA: sugar ABC transporter permease [Chthonomonadales bacterium]|nr:sugar ABC transporter permease [Chthonomonadales bacterium]